MSDLKDNPRMGRFFDTRHQEKNLTPISEFQTCPLVSLAEALKFLTDDDKRWKKYIGEAYTECKVSSEHGLTHEESAAIYLYTMQMDDLVSFYRRLNDALATGDRKMIRPWYLFLKLFDSALEKLPNYTRPVWRGIKANVIGGYRNTHVCTWWRFTSCSASVEVVKTFMGNNDGSTLFMIEVCNGKRIADYSCYSNEDEVLLKMGTTFYVRSQLTNHLAIDLFHLTETNRITPPHGAQWKTKAEDVAGGHGEGDRTHQLNKPHGIFVDKDRTVYIADYENHRIVAWKSGVKPVAKSGTVIVGQHGKGNGLDQVDGPRDVAIDPTTNNLLICDQNNRRILVWPLSPSTGIPHVGEVIIQEIACARLTVDSKGSVYVSDGDKHEVRRFDKGGNFRGTVVAGGHGSGSELNQLNHPTHLFVNAASTLFVSDSGNNRVMKWVKGATEGVVVAGGNGSGKDLKYLSCPQGVWEDGSDNVYVVDQFNHRLMLWEKRATEGKVIVGGRGWGSDDTHLSHPQGLFFDWEGNLYISDTWNHRVERFSII